MSKMPPIPSEQRSFMGAAHADRDAKTAQPGDADTNFDEKGRQANIRQNLTPQRISGNR